ncbi:MAG: GAF domain-containing protein [Actinobacteria bacterium]|nr:GAF domain-containing protein [Actinomycetota bacterium]
MSAAEVSDPPTGATAPAGGAGSALRSWRSADWAFAVGLAVYVAYAVVALMAGLAAALALPLGLHDRLHELAFTSGALAPRFAAVADASHAAEPAWGLVLDYAFSLVNLALAGFLLWLRPRERTARLLAVALVGTAAVFNLQAYAVYEQMQASFLDQAGNVAFHVVAAGAYIAALLVFPDGRPVPRWSPVRLAGLYGIVSVTVGVVAFRISGTSRTLAVLIVFGLLTPAVGVAAQAYRLARATGTAERAQARTMFWALAPALVLGLYVVARGSTASAFEVYGGRSIAIIPVELFRVFQPVFAIIPLALFAGVVRFRLWGIDRIITRALTYTSLAGLVTLVYVGVVVGIGRLVGAQNDNLVLSVVATGLVAIAFEPARERVKRLADRMVYGRRATPLETLADFSTQVGEETETEDKLVRLAQVLGEGTAARRSDIWLRIGDELRPAASWPGGGAPHRPLPLTGDDLPALPASVAVPVRHDGELLGVLALTLPGDGSLAPVDQRLLHTLAGQAGLLLRNVRLTAELLEHVAQLVESRQRVITAQDEVRRRLERNLHDGAQQQLVSLRVKLGLAQRMVQMGRDVDDLLGQLADEAEEAVKTLRELAHGIYPPLLAERGLTTALGSRAERFHLPVVVESGELDRYGQDIEAAVYFCCLEALQNVAKYAEASLVRLELSDEGGFLRFAVVDDGAGFDTSDIGDGAGLQNMRDRLDALGGHVSIDSAPGRGTRVEGRIPVAATDRVTTAAPTA